MLRKNESKIFSMNLNGQISEQTFFLKCYYSKSNFCFEKLSKDFGEYMLISTQIPPKKKHIQCMSQSWKICLAFT